jgi:hypothetical protein
MAAAVAGTWTRSGPRDALVATFGPCHAVSLSVVVTVGPSALLLSWRGYADPAPRGRPAPRFGCAKGLLAEIASALLVANCEAAPPAPSAGQPARNGHRADVSRQLQLEV